MPKDQRYAYIILLCLASESEERGIIVDLFDDDIAFELEMHLEDWHTLKSKFKVKGLIDFDADTVTICDWDSMQYDKPSDRAEETRRRKREQRARDEAKRTLEAALAESVSHDVTESHADVTPMSRDVTLNVTQIRGEDIRSEQTIEEKNIGDQENKDPLARTIIDVLSATEIEEFEPEALLVDAPLPKPEDLNELLKLGESCAAPPENLGITISSLPKAKLRRAVNRSDQETFRPFLETYNRYAPVHWDRYDEFGVAMIDDLKKFVKSKKDKSLLIFEQYLKELCLDEFLGSPKSGKWRFSYLFSKNKPQKYSDDYENRVKRSQQIAPDRLSTSAPQEKMQRTYASVMRGLEKC